MSIHNQNGGPPANIMGGGGPGITIANNICNGNGYITIASALDLSDNETIQNLQKKVEELEKRLLVLHPNNKLHDKYESLKDAYEAYQIIERLIDGTKAE